jgi:hypothetical protein
MEPIKISMRGLAEVAAARPSRKQSKLKQYKFPESKESIGMSNYYVKALSAIKRHHRGQSDLVNSILQGLIIQATAETDPRKKAKLLNNHRAIVDYLKKFGDRPLVIKPGKSLYYIYKDLMVSARPDLVAEQDGSLVLIKLNLGKDDYDGGVCGVMLHALYEAAQVNGLPIKSSAVECLQTSSGSRIAGPKRGFSDKSKLNRACQEILSLWSAA